MIDLVIDQRRRDLGGFEVGRVLPFAKRRMVGPFVFFDHMGPLEMAAGTPRSADVRPHPHIGLSTVTYLFSGEMRHQDSLGFDQQIRPGEVNWMTAGRGITHSERFDGLIREHGGLMHGIQAWVALPDGLEDTDPGFAHYAASDLPAYESAGFHARLIAGSAFGAKSEVRTYSPMFYAHWQLEPGALAGLPAEYPERAAYVAAGQVEVEGRSWHAGQMLVFAPGETIMFKAEQPSIVMVLGGEPIGPRHIWWNFVSSSQARIEQAKADWTAGRFQLPPHDHDEFIPLPHDETTPAASAQPL
ncbi:MAG: pirin family protein [Caulobacteraceae bacterium]|nr:pirin family protein [Caulobacteraceae bacterium]